MANISVPFDIYPRPQFRRDSYMSLNGEWEFQAEGMEPSVINVPYPPQSKASGIGVLIPDGCPITYRRAFRLPDSFNRGTVLLHFDAIDQNAEIYLNNKPLLYHKGGYHHFSADITDRLTGENILEVRVTDYLDDHTYPYGKQKHKRGGMWYTPVTGIWQSVWLESVPKTYLTGMKLTPALDHVDMEFETSAPVGIAVEFNGASYPVSDGKLRLNVPDPHHWSPEDPYLYNFRVMAGEDEVSSYFALRTVSISHDGAFPRLCLNKKPYFFHGVLDQGYFPEGIFLPETPESYEKDIRLLKACGYNTLRKHIKVEPDIFYHYCDKLGIIVFQDMVNNGEYSFIRDTALPTFSIGKKRDDRSLNTDATTRETFIRSMEETVTQLRNFPCICYYTIFNEGWGQFCGDEMYEKLKALDDTRIIDTASGWYTREKSDVFSDHVYFKKVKLKKTDKPYVLSEFGGYALPVKGHLFNPKKKYGYRTFKEQSAFMDSIEELYRRDVIANIPKGLCADIMTQLSDVEDEINGLITYDRKVVKVDCERLTALAEEMKIRD